MKSPMLSNPCINENPELAKKFGLVLKKLRQERGYTQAGLALQIECDRTYISQLERGIRQPKLAVIFTLASVLTINPDELIRYVMNSVLAKKVTL